MEAATRGQGLAVLSSLARAGPRKKRKESGNSAETYRRGLNNLLREVLTGANETETTMNTILNERIRQSMTQKRLAH
ncbi:hypothetical protein FHT76_000876 [Rhizobium sp. BK176]|nr:hypothetical protein [Rhizobium sp. BK176]